MVWHRSRSTPARTSTAKRHRWLHVYARVPQSGRCGAGQGSVLAGRQHADFCRVPPGHVLPSQQCLVGILAARVSTLLPLRVTLLVRLLVPLLAPLLVTIQWTSLVPQPPLGLQKLQALHPQHLQGQPGPWPSLVVWWMRRTLASGQPWPPQAPGDACPRTQRGGGTAAVHAAHTLQGLAPSQPTPPRAPGLGRGQWVGRT
jgi:hypothetical protein